MYRMFLVLCIALWAVAGASAQVQLGDVHGFVGSDVLVPVVLDGAGGEVSITGILKIDNPTVFYPLRFGQASGELLSSHLQRLTDSTWSFDLRVRYLPGDTACVLRGEVLAGSDSLCVLRLQDVQTDTALWPESQALLSVTSVGPPLPYVRFARLQQSYPNPAVRGQTTTWVYRIDKASDVRLVLYDVGGRIVDNLDFGMRKPGVYTVPYTPSLHMAAGHYWAHLITASGLSIQSFVVVP